MLLLLQIILVLGVFAVLKNSLRLGFALRANTRQICAL